jgi:unsaturated chondroitin disaccharide hydrolase
MTSPGAASTALTDDLQSALLRAVGSVKTNAEAFGPSFPGDTTVGGRYPLREACAGIPEGGNGGWTTSFWSGMQWIGWEATDDSDLYESAVASSLDFTRRLRAGEDLGTHDLGFLFSLSCVLGARLTGRKEFADAAVGAAELLLGRLLPSAGIVQAWGDLSDPAQRGRTIIDSLMNMPLLSWAQKQTGESRFGDVVRSHVSQLRDHIVRPDGSTFHTFHWDVDTGRALFGSTAQGASDASCWARGQAWGIYGFAINGRAAADSSFLDASARCADYFLDHLPEDGVPFWDLSFDEGSDAPRDSSAAAIAAGGLIELSDQLSGETANEYAWAADRILASLAENYTPTEAHPSDALLLHGVYDFPGGIGIDEGTLWGDYFYLEALQRRTHPEWLSPWSEDPHGEEGR